jgi:hypothetical protein
VSRIDNLTGNGINVVKEIVNLFERYNLHCKVLAAIFKMCRGFTMLAFRELMELQLHRNCLKHPGHILLLNRVFNSSTMSGKSFMGIF